MTLTLLIIVLLVNLYLGGHILRRIRILRLQMRFLSAQISALTALVDTPSQPKIVFYNEGKRTTTMQLKDSQALPLSIVAEDKFGNPVPTAFDAPPQWAPSDPSLGDVKAADDGLSAVFTPNGKLGDTSVQVSALMGGKAVAGELPVTVIAGDATQIVITPGVPSDI